MIVVQWSMTEFFIDIKTRELVGKDERLLSQYEANRNFQQRLNFWRNQIEEKLREPIRSQLLRLIERIQNLNSQRDEVIHRAWAGGIEAQSWGAGGITETTDAKLLTKAEEKGIKQTSSPRDMIRWDLTFSRLRRMAREMAALNRDLMMLLADGTTPR